jgi:hypothetical protein
MHIRRLLLLEITLASLGAMGLPVRAAGRVELELSIEERAPLTTRQEWLRRLAQAGVGNVRIGGTRASKKVEVAVGGTERSPVYTVTGVINSSGELLVPGARFRPAQAAQLAQWLNDLAQSGPTGNKSQKSAFGLSGPQFQRVRKELSQPVGFSTKGMGRRQLIQKLAGRLLLPVQMAPDVLEAIEDDDVVAEELSSLSCGTALACVVRPLGMCMVPRESGTRGLACVVTKSKPNMEAWPVGWKPEKKAGDVLPGMFEFLNINVLGVAVPQVLEAVGGRLEVPVLMDHNALARHGIEPTKAFVTLPPRRTSYSLLLKKALYQAGLKSELRVDESDKPFLWITTIKPL